MSNRSEARRPTDERPLVSDAAEADVDEQQRDVVARDDPGQLAGRVGAEAAEHDLLEQHQDAESAEPVSGSVVPTDEAAEGDALEQSLEVAGDGDDDYPRDDDRPREDDYPPE